MRILIYILFVVVIISSCKNVSHYTYPNLNTNIDTFLFKNYIKKGDSFYMVGQYAQSKLYFDTLISIDSTRGGFYFKRGLAKFVLLRTRDSSYYANVNDIISDYKTAIKRNYSQKEYAFYNAGLAYSIIGQYDSAIVYFNECLKIDPNNIKANKEKKIVLNLVK